MRVYIKQNNALKSVRLFSKDELIPPEPPFDPTPELVYTLSADGTYYIVGTGFTSIEAINADASGGTKGSGLSSSWTTGEVNIPAMYNGKPVKAIAPRAFNDVKTITKIYIQDGQMTTIGHRAFQTADLGYDTLCTEIHLPNTLTELGGESGRVFWGRRATGFSVNLENTQITSIRQTAFYECNSLTSITVPNLVASIGESAFRNCHSLTSVTFEENSRLASIGISAFTRCLRLTSITIPSGVTSIGDTVFDTCSSLGTFNFGGTMSQWSNVSKGSYWRNSTPFTVVHCTDGDVPV